MSPHWRSCLKRLLSSPSFFRHPPRRHPRLRVESLEDRLTPTYVVTTTADVVNPNDGVLSLREAVIAANASYGIDDYIIVPAGTFVLTLTGASEDAAATGDLDISGGLIIQGAGAASTIVDGNLADRIFDIHPGVGLQPGNVQLYYMTVRDGVDRGGYMLGTQYYADGIGGGIRSQGPLYMSGCAVTDNRAIGADQTTSLRIGQAYGGGIYETNNDLALADCIIQNNQALGGNLINSSSDLDAYGGGAFGGGVYANVGLGMSGCMVMGNQAIGGDASRTLMTNITGGEAVGGGIVGSSNAPRQNVANTIAGNRAVGGNGSGPFSGNGGNASAGGLWLSGSAAVSNCTVSGNEAVGGTGTTTGANTAGQGGEGRGGGVIAEGSVISNSTITLNAARGGSSNRTAGVGTGGGLYYRFGANSTNEAFRSTILAGNTAATFAPDIAGTNTSASQGNNLIGIGVGANGFVNGIKGDQVGTSAAPIDPRLRPLAYNGGPTPTHALLSGSPAIDKGANPAGLTTDQRGTGFPRVVGAAADVGAYEVPPVIVTSVAVNIGQANLVQRSMVTLLTVTFANAVTFTGAPVDAFQLTRTGPGGPNGNVTLAVDLTGSTPTQTIARLTFSGPLTEGPAGAPSLIDGNYTLTVFSNQVNNGAVAGDQTATLYRLFGDVNGDRAINGLDLTAFRNAFGTVPADANYLSYLDFNGDGAINGSDLAAFRNRFGVVLP
jgi:CSLREA domain-containing protein